MADAAHVVSVNVSLERPIARGHTTVTTGIYKTPVSGRVALRGVNLAGDTQADRNVHGGPDRAVYAYAGEDYDWWAERLGSTLAPGLFGENLTLRGVDVSGARIGERWRVGSAVVQVTSPRVPCWKLATVMHDPHFIKAFADALRPGAYLRIISEGTIAAGDAVEVLARPEHDLTLAQFARIFFFDRTRATELLAVPDVTDSWHDWAREQIA